MNKVGVLFLAGCIALVLFSCSTMDSVLKGVDTVEKIGSAASSGTSGKVLDAGTSAKGVDFRKGEVLSSLYQNSSLMDNSYSAAKVMTSASDATQGQAEVLFGNGEKKWVMHTIPSHKAGKNEMELSRIVLFIPNYSDDEELSEENYRNRAWKFGRITSTDELFKDMVEIDGRSYFVKWVRVSDQPVE